MFTVDDITGFFLENASNSRKVAKHDFQGVSIIERWVGFEKKGNIIIKGYIHNHPKYPQGVRINTSSIMSYFSEKGRVYITTKNSIYELGQPLNEVELVFKAPDSQSLEKMTVWS